MKVMVVDDMQLARKNMRKVLEREGIEVFEASEGKQALEIFKNNKLDLICLDIDMPDIDGISVLKEIRSTDKNVKVMMISAMTSDENFKECLKSGAVIFLAKPLDLNLFIETVKVI